MPESPQVISLGWILPRSQDAEQVAAFYGEVLHLPLLRGYANAWLFWAGETVVFEPKSDAGPDWRFENWQSSPTLPVVRSIDIDSVRSRLLHYNVEIVFSGEDDFGEHVVIRDRDGHFVLFRQPPTNSERSLDAVARDRLAVREQSRSFNPGVAPMPADIQGIDTVIRHVSDLAAMTAYYTDTVGLRLAEEHAACVVLDCGDSTALELRPGGEVRPAPSDRFEVPDAFILRVNDFDGFRQRLIDRDAHIVNDRIQFGRGALGYFCDPEGHLVGYEERYEQRDCPDDVVAFAEDLEANRRWREAVRR